MAPPLAARIAAIRRAARSLVAAPAGSVRASAASAAKPAGSRDAGHLGGEVFRDCRGQQPRHAGPDDIAADQREHPAAQGDEIGPGVAAGPAGVTEPGCGHLPPGQVARGVGAAGHPPVLPGAAGLLFQPVHQLGQADSPAGLQLVPVSGERGREQPRQHEAAPLAGRRPAGVVRRAGREPPGQCGHLAVRPLAGRICGRGPAAGGCVPAGLDAPSLTGGHRVASRTAPPVTPAGTGVPVAVPRRVTAPRPRPSGRDRRGRWRSPRRRGLPGKAVWSSAGRGQGPTARRLSPASTEVSLTSITSFLTCPYGG